MGDATGTAAVGVAIEDNNAAEVNDVAAGAAGKGRITLEEAVVLGSGGGDGEHVIAKHLELKRSDMLVRHVCVFEDRAEVRRGLDELEVPKGLVEVVLDDFTLKCDTSSFRVSGVRGDVIILEVMDEKVVIKDPRADVKNYTKLSDDLKEKQNAVMRLEKEKEWLVNYARQLHSDKVATLNFQQATEFMTYYRQQMERLDSELAAVQKEVEERTKELDIAGTAVRKEQHAYRVTITLRSNVEQKISLDLSYVMRDACWKPQYDVRMTTGAEELLQLVYYGIITNDTGDDWVNAPISLSTAQPQLGQPPQLPTAVISFHYDNQNYYAKKNINKSIRRKERAPAGVLQQSRFATASAAVMDLALGESDEEAEEEELDRILSTNVKKNKNSANFEIPRAATILADNKPHKVCIGIIDFSPDVSYMVVPSLSQHAYLRARCTNVSEYLLLAGPANIYVDNMFLTRSNLLQTNPGEDFSMYLGADASIVVKFVAKESSGTKGFALSRTGYTIYTNEISVKNTKSSLVNIIVYGQLPQSKHESIKVNLNKPVLDVNKFEGPNEQRVPVEVEKGLTCVLDTSNNLRWEFKLDSQSKRVIPLEYTIEYPSKHSIQIN